MPFVTNIHMKMCFHELLLMLSNTIALLLQMPLMHISLDHMLYCCSKHVLLDRADEEP